MIIEPKVRGFICVTTHPTGCRQNVLHEIDFFKKRGVISSIPPVRNVLVVGGSTGYGLSTRIASAFCLGANTFNISLEREPKPGRAASPGWYNSRALEEAATAAGLHASSLFCDAFNPESKKLAIQHIATTLAKVSPKHQQIDLLVYSVAAPKRQVDGKTYSSVLKPIGKTIDEKTVNWHTRKVSSIKIEAASKEEVEATVKVMGGEDWASWVTALKTANLLANGVKTVAYSYIGPKITADVYREGTIGAAKKHLEKTAVDLKKSLADIEGNALVSVNKALVTQASAAIPIIPLYLSILIDVLTHKGLEEDCAMQIDRLLRDKLYHKEIPTDELGRLRVDDYEMRKDVQDEVLQRWNSINDSNLEELSSIDAYSDKFLKLFGFRVEGVDYKKEIML